MKIAYTPLFLLFLILSCIQNQKTQKTNADKYSNLTKNIPIWLNEYNVPAVSVAVIENEEIAYNNTFGFQNENVPANNNTLFLSASIAKPMTAEVFLRLANMGKVSLDEPMYNYWLDPDIAQDERAKLLTPRHVFTHQTGFKNWRRMTNDTLRFEWEPGTKMGYSGEGFLYLVRFLEKKLEKPFNKIAEEVLFNPESMQNSSYVYQNGFDEIMAWAYYPDSTWREPRKVKNAFGAGGLRITAEDYAKFILSIINNKKVIPGLRNEQFTVSLNQFEHCQKHATIPAACPKNVGFGLGWYIYGFEDEKVIGHTGANLGERTLAVFSLNTKSGLVVMSNGSKGNYVIYKIAKEIGVNENFINIEKPKQQR